MQNSGRNAGDSDNKTMTAFVKHQIEA